MKKVESVASRIRKEILKEARKQLGVLPDDLRNVFLSVLSTLIRTTVLRWVLTPLVRTFILLTR